MPTNKNALLRYQILDKCFSNFGRKYFFQELLDELNRALSEADPDTNGIQKRQLWNDINFMKSENGYGAPIEAIREGRKPYYRYADKKFSINNRPLNETEFRQLRDTITFLGRFEDAPQFEWLSEIGPLLRDTFGVDDNENKKIIAYEANIEYSGYHYITKLYNAIVNKRVLNITYKPFDKDKIEFNFHPYYLKQYNNRWFCFGLNDSMKDDSINVDTWNVPLDRIAQLKENGAPYIDSSTDWEEYFSDIIGVSKRTEKCQQIVLLFHRDVANYILTKPLHPYQKKPEILSTGEVIIRLNLIINYELVSEILSFGEKVKVLAPKELAEKVSIRLKQAAVQYGS